MNEASQASRKSVSDSPMAQLMNSLPKLVFAQSLDARIDKFDAATLVGMCRR